MPAAAPKLVPAETLERRILLVRDLKVMLDRDLAELYGVQTKALNQAVKRNLGRFPPDFMFTLTAQEATAVECLRSQFVTSNQRRGGSRYRPYAFTEQGVAMLSSVLKSKRAITVNIAIMRAFVRLRQVLATHRELLLKFENLERQVARNSHDIKRVYDVINQLLAPPEPEPKRRIGFLSAGDNPVRA